MLKRKCNWNIILRKSAKAIKPTFGVMVLNVSTDEINFKKIKKSIDMIKNYNKEIESLKAIDIS